MEITIPHKYQPRAYQLPFLQAMDNGKKRALLLWHRRSGKDKTIFNFMIKKAFERVGAYYYFFPEYAQGRKILWDGIDKDGFKTLDHIPQAVRKRQNDQEMKIELSNGSIIQIVGTDNYNSIVGTNPVGCAFSEFALQDPEAWSFVRPILAENGGWAVFDYTPRGKNHGYGLYQMAKSNPDWYCQKLTIIDTKRDDGTPVISQETITSERNEGLSEEMIQQEYYCSFEGSVVGAYYATQMDFLQNNNRLLKGLYEPTLPVSTWWDLGINDSMAITFTQQVGREVRIIDFIEDSGEGVAYYAKKLLERPYTYLEHFWPHDGEVRELGTGKTRKEVGESLGIKPITIVPAPNTKDDGIEAVRSFLPKVWIDIDKAQRLVDCLSYYSKKWDEKNKVFKSTPNHDWSSHGADSMQTLALGYRDRTQDFVPKFTISYDEFGRPSIF
jgi:hypothetical protein